MNDIGDTTPPAHTLLRAARAGLPMFLGGALMILAGLMWPDIFPSVERLADAGAFE